MDDLHRFLTRYQRSQFSDQLTLLPYSWDRKLHVKIGQACIEIDCRWNMHILS